ncbi:MAG TPA: aldehyde dehydrogenase family protein [Acidimicrobiales bacterium]|jgi:succinate-semialdehyde dehydrogenase/glutarate-semialdehyde dehydrogenase|nr:aldehyde dehydrogenase family protein [Acidimicrobiales bacterium]
MTTSAHERRVIDEAVVPRLQIGGEWRDASGGASSAVEDPATCEVICRVADATEDDALAALDAAAEAQAAWATHPPRERGEILRRAWQMLIDRREDLALRRRRRTDMRLPNGRALPSLPPALPLG